MVATGQCYGWINPVLTYLLSPESPFPMSSTELSWIVAIIEVGTLVSPLPGGMLGDYIGRKPVILASAPVYIAGWVLVLYCHTPVMLGVARTIHGVALGLAYTGVPIYLGEIAEKNTRGAITSLFSSSWWAGFLVSYAVGPILTFRQFTWFSLAFNVPLLLLFSWQPESPYYYAKAGKNKQAYDSLKWFRDSSPEYLEAELDEIKESVKENKNRLSFQDIISTPVDRKGLILLNILLAVRTMSGISSLLVFSTQMFLMTPNLYVRPEVITIVFGVVMLGGSFVGTFTTDTCGRRPLLLVSSVGCLLCQICLAVYYYLLFESSVVVSTFSWAAPVLVILYAVLCSAGMYPVSSVYTSELFTSNTRGLASGIASLNITVFCFISLVIYQPITDSVGLYGNFVVFAVILFFGSIYFYFIAPETRGKSFLEIREELGK